MIHETMLRVLCGTEESCYRLFPQVFEEYRYFSDGAIAVRIPAPGESDTRLHRVKNLNVVFEGFDLERCTEVFPVHQTGWHLAQEKCRECGETRLVATPNHQAIAGRTVAGHYVLWIAALGHIWYDARGGPEDRLFFIGPEGLHGAVMPILNGASDEEGLR
jgi:hypothetical protein